MGLIDEPEMVEMAKIIDPYGKSAEHKEHLNNIDSSYNKARSVPKTNFVHMIQCIKHRGYFLTVSNSAGSRVLSFSFYML